MKKIKILEAVRMLALFLALPLTLLMAVSCDNKTTPAAPVVPGDATFTKTMTPAYSATSTGTPAATNTSTPTSTSTTTGTLTSTATPTSTRTSTDTVTVSGTPTFTASSTTTATATHTPVSTDTATASGTPTLTASSTPSATSTNTPVSTDTATVTTSPTQTTTVTVTMTGTLTPVTGFTNPSGVDLGTSGAYVLLAATGITDANTCVVTGDAGNPAGASIHLTCAEMVSSLIHDSDGAFTGTCSMNDSALGTAEGDMQTAYTNASVQAADVNETVGEIGGLTFYQGVYKWTSDITMSNNLTLSGTSSSVFIFCTTGNLTVANGKTITLSGGVLPQNIYWKVAGLAQLGTTSNFSGIILSKTSVVIQHLAVLTGRALAQSDVTLDANTVTHP